MIPEHLQDDFIETVKLNIATGSRPRDAVRDALWEVCPPSPFCAWVEGLELSAWCAWIDYLEAQGDTV